MFSLRYSICVFLLIVLAACSSSSSEDSMDDENAVNIIDDSHYTKIENVGEMTVPVSEHRDILLRDGRVLITGGAIW